MDKLKVDAMPLWERLAHANKPIVLYGMGNGADKIICELEACGIPFEGVFASDGFVRGQVFWEHTVTTYAQAKEKFGDMVVLVAFGTHRQDVMQNILRISGEQEVYVPDVEVAGSVAFTESFFEAHKSEFEQAYELLADKESRELYTSMLNYKIGGEISRLMEYTSDDGLFSQEFLNLSEDEIYVDAGAYDGDTVQAFAKRVGNYKKIYALEPDAKNFKKLLKNTKEFDNCVCFNSAADDANGNALFAANAGRQSALNGDVGQAVQTCKIDGIAPDATLIKLDVEGNERRAIIGACEVISKNKPKMLVSAYHRNEDLYALPLQVFEQRQDYRVYLRRFPAVPAWDLIYYFV
ncbi:FkbM family methyltransferase [Christensenellaceae bacterium OttesenSCG-928-K19]|nr:FkbM family methyltransferase [Christensenellaceae bacterium OttesenSCG-928-K19]